MVVTQTHADTYAHPHHAKIWAALSEAVQDAGQGMVKWTDVKGYINKESQARITLRDLATNGTSISEKRAKRVVSVLDKMFRARKIVSLSEAVKTDALNGMADEAYSELMDGVFALGRDRFSSGAQYVGFYVDDALTDIETRKNANGIVGLETGMEPLDTIIKGLQKKQLVMIGARPGNYKSVAAGQVADAVSLYGKRALICSPEMAAEQYITRLASVRANVDYDTYNAGNYTPDEEKRLRDAVEHYRTRNIVINEAGTQTTATIRQDVIRYKPDVLIVDYLQLIEPVRPTGHEYRDVGIVSKELAAMKKDFGIPIVACVQLSRKVEERMPPRPIASDLRATGQLEQDADSIFMLYFPKEYSVMDDITGEYKLPNGDVINPELLEWICVKNRHGRKDNVETYVRDGRMHISND